LKEIIYNIFVTVVMLYRVTPVPDLCIRAVTQHASNGVYCVL